MNILLIFFAIPLATIILSIILETFINCPFKVAGIFFSIFIVIAFALGGTANLIVAAIIYTIISFITATTVRFIINRLCNNCTCNTNTCDNNCRNNYYNNFDNNSFNNTNPFSLNTRLNNNFNRIALGVNNDNSVVNSLSEETTINSNNNGNMCRRCR